MHIGLGKVMKYAAVSFWTVPFFLGSTVLAADDPIGSVMACREIEDNNARLDCFDAAVAGLPRSSLRSDVDKNDQAQVGSVSNDVDLTITNSRESSSQLARLNPNQDDGTEFGADDLRKNKPRDKANGPKRELVAGLVDIGKNRRGKYLILLDNDQVWRQLSADSNSLLIPKDLGGATAKIRRKSMGSHILTLSTGRRSIRVERIK